MTAKTAVQGLRDAGIKPKPGEGLDDYLNRGGKEIIRRMYADMPPEARHAIGAAEAKVYAVTGRK